MKQTALNHASTDYDRIAAVIEHIESCWPQRPGLRELADRVNLSEFHFQRMFHRWAGITPKQFMQFMTLAQARRLLREERSVLDATLDLELSSPARLHDLFVTIDAVTPGEYKNGGRGLIIDYGVHETPFGYCLLGVTERGICWLSFADQPTVDSNMKEFQGYWPGAKLRCDLTKTKIVITNIFSSSAEACYRLLLRGTNFQVKVWEALLKISPGQIATYEQLAAAIGQPLAVRAVGQAAAANPVAYLIPCHRIIQKSGFVGNYRWGPIRKRALLTYENAASHATITAHATQ